MKISASKTLSLLTLAAILGMSFSSPAHADWDDRWHGDHYWHHEREEHCEHEYYRHWYPDPNYYGAYYGYSPVIVQPAPRVVYERPVYAEPPAWSVFFDLR